MGKPRDLAQDKVMELVALLIDLKVWQQQVPELETRPDESRALLRIQVAETDSQIWEWYNDMVELDRII